jgi:signal transduction histidine kinase/HPt (histidine-containing phosphotransfer) domain-containing protein/methylmalonyl-CoA mutase cobalamin-binding subunit
MDKQPQDLSIGDTSLPSQIRLLAIDDDTDVLAVYKTLFQNSSSNVTDTIEDISALMGLEIKDDRIEKLPFEANLDVYTGGEMGVDAIRQSLNESNPYAIVFLDMRMPGGWDGFKTAQHIREIDPIIRIIFVSAYMDTSMAEMRKTLGPNFAYLAKPFNRDELIQSTLLLGCDWYREKRLMDTEKNLRASLQQVQEAKQERDQFFASISHELRTPLTVLIGMSEVLSDSVLDDDQTELLTTMEVAARSQLSLINDVLDLSKIESNKFSIDEAPYSLSCLLNEIDRMFSSRAGHLGVQFKVIQDAMPEAKVIGDGKRIGQILINLLGNAIKFTIKGEIRLKVWADDQLHFRVEDSGIGMDEAALDRLFKPYEQADNTISRRFGGTGLGLNISWTLAELMGGTIDVESRKGEGSSFQLNLPLVLSELHTSEAIACANTSSRETQFKGSVLLADDSPEIQMVIQRMLEAVGVTVILANNGQEAIDAALMRSFDLILMDMQMPYVDGVQATRNLRELGITTIIVALTGNVLPEHREAFKAAGCDSFLAKPVDRNMLLDTIKERLPIADNSALIAGNENTAESALIDDDLMALFKASTEKNRESILEALSCVNWDQVKKTAHTIKGCGTTFGFPNLTKLGKEICDALDEDENAIPVDKVVELLSEMGKLSAT